MANALEMRPLRVGSRTLTPTAVFDSYWRFACERQRIFFARLQGASPPWTNDETLQSFRFTNVYRASDRVSQYLIQKVIYTGSQKPDELIFRTLLFKFFNRIDTWEHLVDEVGEPSWHGYEFKRYASALERARRSRKAVYSPAYIMPNPQKGGRWKHENHLLLLEEMMRSSLPDRVVNTTSLAALYELLLTYPSIGPFLAFQLAIDINYSALTDFSEMDHVVAGPGAKNGIRKCFSDTAGLSNEAVIRAVADHATEAFEYRGLRFQDLWGRPLQLIDCQNLFCEVDKYARVVHPQFNAGGRSRIKQRFAANSAPLPQWYPPKWNLQLSKTKRQGEPSSSSTLRTPNDVAPQLTLL